jgi:hypothetical protein
MLPNDKFLNQGLEFWANIKLLNQKLGYTERKTKKNPNPGFVIPTIDQILKVFKDESFDSSKLINDNKLTPLGHLIIEYLKYRGDKLTREVEPNLMDQKQAKALFTSMFTDLKPSCPLPLNKQKGAKKDYAYLTGIVNMLIEANIGSAKCNYDPRELTSITVGNFPIRTFSRRVDGAFPSTKDPKAIWEIKEYYYTTTFGSRVADGVYETQLDGWELWESEVNIGRKIKHYLFIDDYYTWWSCGKSYLCRLIDSMHMGLVTEVIIGKEVIVRLPRIIEEWLGDDIPQNENFIAEACE